jgi:hypothetical protein
MIADRAHSTSSSTGRSIHLQVIDPEQRRNQWISGKPYRLANLPVHEWHASIFQGIFVP